MKTWTVVVEVNESEDGDFDTLSKEDVENMVGIRNCPSNVSYNVMECTEAPYGPQGVVLEQAKKRVPGTTNFNDVHQPGRAGRVQTAPKEGGK